jgi:hypothetical protein
MRKNHAMIWMLGLGGGVLLAGLAYAFFAQFEHSAWFSTDLRRLLNREEVPIFGGGGVLTAAGIIGVLYASGAFVVGPATFATALPPAHRYDAAGNVRLPISLVRQGRIAHGDVVLLRSGELAFVCLKDESAAAAAAGKAVANQFGLVGALVGAAVSAARESGREEEIARLRHHAMQWPLEQQLSAHALNLRLPAQHLVEFHGGGWFTAMHLRTPSEQLVVHAIEPHDLPVLRGWLAHFGVAQRG